MTSETDFDRSHLPHLAIYGCLHLPSHFNDRPLEARELDEKLFVTAFNAALKDALMTAGVEVEDAECSCTIVTYPDVKPHSRAVRPLPVWGAGGSSGVRREGGSGVVREKLTKEERFAKLGMQVVEV